MRGGRGGEWMGTGKGRVLTGDGCNVNNMGTASFFFKLPASGCIPDLQQLLCCNGNVLHAVK